MPYDTPHPVPASADASASDALLQLLDREHLPYERVEHAPVFTIADALAATPQIGGIRTKNVFLRDAKGVRHFLVIVPHDRRLDLAALAPILGTSKLSLASAERLQRHLGVTPGAVSVLALMRDRERQVELVLDTAVWQADKLQAHPLRNTATLALDHAALVAFLALTGHAPRVLEL